MDDARSAQPDQCPAVNPTNTLNKYVYGANNPLKYIDKDGKDITIFYRPPSGASRD